MGLFGDGPNQLYVGRPEELFQGLEGVGARVGLHAPGPETGGPESVPRLHQNLDSGHSRVVRQNLLGFLEGAYAGGLPGSLSIRL